MANRLDAVVVEGVRHRVPERRGLGKVEDGG